MNGRLEELQREFGSGLRGLTAEGSRLRTEDDPRRWCIQEIVEHLLLTYGLSVSIFAERVDKQRPTKARATLSQRVGQVMVLRLGKFPQGREAPERVRPVVVGEALSGEQLSERTREALERFDAVAVRAEELFGSERAISHQVLGPMSVMGWRTFHLIHGRHHLKQIAAIRAGHGT